MDSARSQHLAVALLARGDIKLSEIQANIERLHSQLPMVCSGRFRGQFRLSLLIGFTQHRAGSHGPLTIAFMYALVSRCLGMQKATRLGSATARHYTHHTPYLDCRTTAACVGPLQLCKRDSIVSTACALICIIIRSIWSSLKFRKRLNTSNNSSVTTTHCQQLRAVRQSAPPDHSSSRQEQTLLKRCKFCREAHPRRAKRIAVIWSRFIESVAKLKTVGYITFSKFNTSMYGCPLFLSV